MKEAANKAGNVKLSIYPADVRGLSVMGGFVLVSLVSGVQHSLQVGQPADAVDFYNQIKTACTPPAGN